MEIAPVPTLTGDRVTLEPLGQEHADDLRAAVADGDLWRTWYTSMPAPAQVDAEIDRRLAEHEAGRMVPFAVRDRPTGRVVGATTFMTIDSGNRRVEIGSTFLARSAQRIGDQHRVEAAACCPTRSKPGSASRSSSAPTGTTCSPAAAIAGLGAKQDGVLRNHAIGRDGTLRDTVVFSVIASEWPAVRLSLAERLRRHDRAEGSRRRSARHA